MSFALVGYVLKAAIRDRLLIALLILMILSTSLSIFMGSSAVIEQDQFTVVFAGGGIRVAGMLGLILFTVFFMRRSFETRDIDYLLSRPISRVKFLLSYSFALSILAAFTAFAQTICVLVLLGNLDYGVLLWSFSILVENIVMVNTTLFFCMFLASAATASMAVLGFYTLCRMMGQILGVLDGDKSSLFEGLEYTMQMVSVLTPRLDLMGQTSWLIYGVQDNISASFIFIQGVLFTGLILCASLIDLVKRQF